MPTETTNSNEPRNSRSYKAFISYRHLPLDAEIAQKVHRTIERFVIPAELRKDGRKNLGYVFRDQDELPIGTLSDNIQNALDHSEFLIVICTPETQKSKWVMREITYFLETHDRNHVLVVIADGSSREALPDELTMIHDADTDMLTRVEPLAAKITAPTSRERNRLFRTEKLRLLAAMIGCSYDDLYKREQRYQRRKFGTIAGLTAAAVLSFMSVLLVKNNQITRQLNETLIKESRLAAAQSASDLLVGDYTSAIRHALSGLPDEDSPRPYVGDAELALNNALRPYAHTSMECLSCFTTEHQNGNLVCSEDGLYLASYGNQTLFLYDADTGELLWSDPAYYLYYPPIHMYEELSLGVTGARNEHYHYSTLGRDLKTGTVRWTLSDHLPYASDGSHSRLLCINYSDTNIYDFIDPADGTVLASFPEKRSINDCLFSDDGSVFYALLFEYSSNTWTLCAYSCETGALIDEIPIDLPASGNYKSSAAMASCGEELYLNLVDDDGYALIMRYDLQDTFHPVYSKKLEIQKHIRLDASSFSIRTGACELFDIAPDTLYYGSNNQVWALSRKTGEVLRAASLPGDIITSRFYADTERWGLVLENGVITQMSADLSLSYHSGVYFLAAPYALADACIDGSSYKTSRFHVIPAPDRHQVQTYGIYMNETLEPVIDLTDFDYLDTDLFISPSMRYVAALTPVEGSLAENSYYTGIWLDRSTGQRKELSIPSGKRHWLTRNDFVLCDDGKLLSRIWMDNLLISYDPTSDKAVYLEDCLDMDSTSLSLKSYSVPVDENTLITLVTRLYDSQWHEPLQIFQNEELIDVLDIPEQIRNTVNNLNDVIPLESGCFGLRFKTDDYSDKDFFYDTCSQSWLELPDSFGTPSVITVKNLDDSRRIAFSNGKDTIRIVDPTGEAEPVEFYPPYSMLGMVDMSYAPGQNTLYLFYQDGRVLSYDDATGEEITDYTRSDGGFSSGQYRIQVDEEQAHTYITSCTNHRGKSCTLIVDDTDGSVIADYSDVFAVNPVTREVLTGYYMGDNIYSGKLYSLKELIEMGKKRLSKYETE